MTPDALVCYNYVEDSTDNEKLILPQAKEFLFPIGTLVIDDWYQGNTTTITHTEGNMLVATIPIQDTKSYPATKPILSLTRSTTPI
jgi:hypothetical protein